jgi:hypothetical protein
MNEISTCVDVGVLVIVNVCHSPAARPSAALSLPTLAPKTLKTMSQEKSAPEFCLVPTAKCIVATRGWPTTMPVTVCRVLTILLLVGLSLMSAYLSPWYAKIPSPWSAATTEVRTPDEVRQGKTESVFSKLGLPTRLDGEQVGAVEVGGVEVVELIGSAVVDDPREVDVVVTKVDVTDSVETPVGSVEDDIDVAVDVEVAVVASLDVADNDSAEDVEGITAVDVEEVVMVEDAHSRPRGGKFFVTVTMSRRISTWFVFQHATPTINSTVADSAVKVPV